MAMDRVYVAFGQVLAERDERPFPRSPDEESEQVAGLRKALLSLLADHEGEFAGVDLSSVFSEVAREAEVLRRTGSHETVAPQQPTARTPGSSDPERSSSDGFERVRSNLLRRDDEESSADFDRERSSVRRSGKVRIESRISGSVPQRRDSRVVTGDFDLRWTDAPRRAELKLNDSDARTSFATRILGSGTLRLALEPQPVVGTTIEMQVLAKGGQHRPVVPLRVVHCSDDGVLLSADNLPVGLRDAIESFRRVVAREPAPSEPDRVSAARPSAPGSSDRWSRVSTSDVLSPREGRVRRGETQEVRHGEVLADENARPSQSQPSVQTGKAGTDGTSGPARARSGASAEVKPARIRRGVVSDESPGGSTGGSAGGASPAAPTAPSGGSPNSSYSPAQQGRESAPAIASAHRPAQREQSPPPATSQEPTGDWSREVSQPSGSGPQQRPAQSYDRADSWSRSPSQQTPVAFSPTGAVPVAGQHQPPPTHAPTVVGQTTGAIPSGAFEATLLHLATQHEHCEIELTGGGKNYVLAVRGGDLVDVRRHPPSAETQLSELLVKSEYAGPKVIERARERAQRIGTSLERELLEAGAVDYKKLRAVLKTRLKLLVREVFDVQFERYVVRDFDRLDIDWIRPTVRIPETIFTQMRQRIDTRPMDELERFVKQHGQSTASLNADADAVLEHLGLDEKEERFLRECLDGETPIERELAKTSLRRRDAVVILTVFDDLGLLDWELAKVESLRAQRVRKGLEKKAAEIDSAGPFELLECHWSSYTSAVSEAYVSLNRQLDVEYALEEGDIGLRELAERVRTGLMAARDELSDRASRERLRKNLVDGFERRSAVALYEKQAEMALFKEDAHGARDAYRRILELDPRHAVARKNLSRLEKATE